MTTPSTVSLLTRSMSCTVGGGWARVSAPWTPGAVMIISSDLDWLSSRLFVPAQSLTSFSKKAGGEEIRLY